MRDAGSHLRPDPEATCSQFILLSYDTNHRQNFSPIGYSKDHDPSVSLVKRILTMNGKSLQKLMVSSCSQRTHDSMRCPKEPLENRQRLLITVLSRRFKNQNFQNFKIDLRAFWAARSTGKCPKWNLNSISSIKTTKRRRKPSIWGGKTMIFSTKILILETSGSEFWLEHWDLGASLQFLKPRTGSEVSGFWSRFLS